MLCCLYTQSWSTGITQLLSFLFDLTSFNLSHFSKCKILLRIFFLPYKVPASYCHLQFPYNYTLFWWSDGGRCIFSITSTHYISIWPYLCEFYSILFCPLTLSEKKKGKKRKRKNVSVSSLDRVHEVHLWSLEDTESALETRPAACCVTV